MVVDHNHVERKLCPLRQCTLYSIANGLCTIEDGNHHRCLNGKILLVEVDVSIRGGVNQRMYCFQMLRARRLHLDLYVAVAWVHIVELPLAALARVEFYGGVEQLVQMEQLLLATEEEAQVVPTGKAVYVACVAILLLCVGGLCPSFRQRGAQQYQRSEVEVVAQRTFLIIDDGMLDDSLLATHRLFFQIVTVDHCRLRLVGSSCHAGQRIGTRHHGRCLQVEQDVVGGSRADEPHGLRGEQVADDERLAAFCGCGMFFKIRFYE